MQPPTLQDVFSARPRVYAAMRPSPLLKHPLLDQVLGEIIVPTAREVVRRTINQFVICDL